MAQSSPVDQIASSDVFESFKNKSNAVISNTNKMYTEVGNVDAIATVLTSNNVSDAIVELNQKYTTYVGYKIPSTYFVLFPGEIGVTTAGNEYIVEPYSGNSVDFIAIESVQVTASQRLGSSGTTEITISESGVGSSGGDLILSIPYDQKFASNSNTSFNIANGNKLYVYCSSSARHQDVQVNIYTREI